MRKIVGLFIVMFSVSSHASSALNGMLSNLSFFKEGYVIVYTDGTRDGSPCGGPNRFVIDGSTVGGKVVVSGLSSAYALGKKVSIYGMGGGTGCSTVFTDTEMINYFSIVN